MALRCNRAEHVREAIIQMAVYAGMPAALDGYRLFDAVIKGKRSMNHALSPAE
jgi:alkylhydroperoxidase/carboxymuconolactone decarboxylase family protein YurZ